jgi:hypothetical protein
MPEGLSAPEVGQEIAHHAQHAGDAGRPDRRERSISIAEVVLLSLVAVLAAWSGYAAATWNTESSVTLAAAGHETTRANRAQLQAMNLRNFDSSTFNAWFTAFTAGNDHAAMIAERRFRPTFRVAFDAWRRTKPDTNPKAPPGPTYMPQYKQPALQTARELEAQAEHDFAAGESAGETSDKYIRTTVFLASVLFLVGISTQFPVRGGRYALVGLGTVLVLFSLLQLAQLRGPPG